MAGTEWIGSNLWNPQWLANMNSSGSPVQMRFFFGLGASADAVADGGLPGASGLQRRTLLDHKLARFRRVHR